MDKSKFCLNCFNEKNGDGTCPHCGYVLGGASEEHYYLPGGSTLQERYIVGTVLGHGGFGITYIGYDTKLDKRVAIKEYLPTDISTRVPGRSTVTTFSGEKYDQFAYGLERFIGEAKTLTRYGDSPGIVSISDYFSENNTAYIVMEYLDGITLSEYLKRSGGTVSYEETISIVRPVMDALREVHSAGMIHRDVSPDNIFITTNNQIKLLDFGAARHAMGEKSKSLSVVLKPGYAPPEQYYAHGKQGPWTDVYALAATMYRILTGQNPPEAMERVLDDAIIDLRALSVRLPVRFARTVMRALSVRVEDRYQTVAEFEDALFGEGSAPEPEQITVKEPEPEPVKAEAQVEMPDVPKQKTDAAVLTKDAKKKKRLIGGIAAVAVIALVVIISVTGKQPSSNTSLSNPATTTGDLLESYEIGVNTWGSGVPILDAFGDNAEYALVSLGNTTMRASDDFTPDKESANIQNFCAVGVDGITMQAAGVTNLLQMGDTCLNAKVPFVLFFFIGEEADRENLQNNNPYYVGCINADMVTDGKEVARMALEDGCKTAVIIGGNIGDNDTDQRSKGFCEAFEAGGGKILSETRCTDASECATEAEDMLSANKDADCLYAMDGNYIPGSLSVINEMGLTGSINIYMSCVDETSAEYIKDGAIKAGNDGIMLASLIAPTLLQNYLDGHPILDEYGKAPHLQTYPIEVNQDNVDAYMSVFATEGVQPVTVDMLQNLCWRYNQNVTYRTYLDLIYNGLTLDALMEANEYL